MSVELLPLKFVSQKKIYHGAICIQMLWDNWFAIRDFFKQKYYYRYQETVIDFLAEYKKTQNRKWTVTETVWHFIRL